MSLAAGWEATVDPSTGRTFYVNHDTQQTSWTPPLDSPLPSGWEERRDELGRTFFLNTRTMSTTWQDPRLHEASSTATSSSSTHQEYPSVPTSYPSFAPSASPAAPVSSEPRFQLKNASSGNTWSCPQCTFSNPLANVKCDMCGAPKPGAGSATSHRAGGGRSTSGGGGGVESDEAMAAALQAELDREASQLGDVRPDRDDDGDGKPDYQATEPFELLPNMVPDETSTKCLKCGKEFGKLVNRKHHCRCCGMLACQECSSKRTVVRLPTQDEALNQKEQRVCDWCFDHLVDGHAHCLYRYVVVASKEQDQNRELAIKGVADIMEHLPQQLSSSSDRAQAMRDLEILKFVGGVPKMCSFLSPGDRPTIQAQACRLVAAVASASCIRELESHLPKRQVASEVCEGAALSIMATILDRPPTKDNLNAQISAARVLYLLGDVPALKSAAREANLVGPLCEALLSSDAQLQDWSCMCLGRLLKGDRQSVEEVLKHNGIHSLVLLLSSSNTLIQEHAALTLQEALVVDPQTQAPKVKKALAGFSGTPAALRLLQSGEAQVVSAGLRLLLILSETEAQQIRSLDGIPALVSIVVGGGSAADSYGADLQVLALQVLRNVAGLGSMERQAITQCGGLSAAVTLMKSSTNSFVRKEATVLVEALSSDADGARGVMEASGGIAGLVDVMKSSSEVSSSFSASNALSQILMQAPEAQAAMLEAGALEALLAAGARGDLPTACRVVEATYSFVSDPQLLPKLAANVAPPTLAQKLIHLGVSNKSMMPSHNTEQLVLSLAVLCGARPDDYAMKTNSTSIMDDADVPPVIKVTSPQTRALVASNGSQWLVSLVQNSIRSEPGVALASLRCLLAVSHEPANGDRIVQGGALPVVLAAIADTLRAGDAPDTSSPHTQILLHSIALFARLCGGTRPRDAGRDLDSVKKGLRLLNEALGCHEPECMLTAVRALSECSFQSGTWSTIAETALPRCVEMLLADKTGQGPGGRDPLSSSDVLRLLMDVSTITSNLAKLEVHSNALLESGGVLALISLLSEPEDDATASGINALWALAESSRRCAAAIARPETGAIVQLLHLAETHRADKTQASRALKLVRRLAETDGQNAAQIGSTGAAVDALLRLVRFEQSEDALGALCAVSSASDALWERLADTSDVSSTVLILERGGSSNSARIQGRACRAIASMCDQNPAMCVAEDVLRGALPTVVKLLSPVDALGADKSESPAVDAAWALAIVSSSALRDNVHETIASALEEYGALRGCILLILRERRLGRPKSQSTAQAMRAVRALLELDKAKSQKQQRFWQEVASAKKEDDVLSALIMALDANVTQTTSNNAAQQTSVANKDALQAVEDALWLLSAFPPGLPAESVLRLARPLNQAFERSLALGAFRVMCLRAMARAVQEPSLASALVGSARNVANSLASEKDALAQVETGALLGALLKNAPNDRIVQDAVGSSGAVTVLYQLLKGAGDEAQVQGACLSLAVLCENGGNAVKRALRQAGGKDLIARLRDLIRSESDDDWEDNSTREACFRILTRIASLDESREDFAPVKSCCFSALVKRKCLRPAVELLGWLGTVGESAAAESGEDDEERVDEALLEIAFDKQIPFPVRLQALQSSEFFFSPSTPAVANFPKDIFYPNENKKLFYPALLVLERLVRLGKVDVQPLLPSLIALMKLDQTVEDHQGLAELVCSCLFEACRKTPALRQTLRTAEGFTKVFKGANLFGQLNAQRLLKVLGEEFVADKPAVSSSSFPGASSLSLSTIKRTDSTASVQSNASVGGEKRSQDELKKGGLLSSPTPLVNIAPPPGGPPPPPPAKSAFPTFSQAPSAQDRSSLELAMRLQQLEMSNGPANTTSAMGGGAAAYPRAPTSNTSSVWACAACTLENEPSATQCAACGTTRRGGSGGPAGGSSLMPPPMPSPQQPGQTRVRCKACMSELLAPSSASQFKCGQCGTVGSVRDQRI